MTTTQQNTPNTDNECPARMALSRLTVRKLKDLCRHHKLRVGGVKAALVERLASFQAHDSPAAPIESWVGRKIRTIPESAQPRRSGRAGARTTYTSGAQAQAVAEAKQRGREKGAALGKKVTEAAMDKCMEAYATCMASNGWELSDVNGAVTAEMVRDLMKKPYTTSGEFLQQFYEIWSEEGWGMGDPVTGLDTDDAEFDNEFRNARHEL